MKLHILICILLLPAILAAGMAETQPELPRSRHIYTLGSAPPLQMVPARAELEGKACEACDFTNYETDFEYTTGAEGKIDSISWRIVNDFDSAPVLNEWKMLGKRFGHLLISSTSTELIFTDGETNFTLNLLRNSEGKAFVSASISNIR